MAKGSASTRILIVDDEPEYVAWIEEYLEARGYSCDYAKNLPEATAALQARDYRLIIIDMNIPALEAITPALHEKTPLVDKYPGIAVAVFARNNSYGAHSVIAYTVHDDDAADRELDKMHCRYVLKGRPNVLKQVIDKSLAPPPR